MSQPRIQFRRAAGPPAAIGLQGSDCSNAAAAADSEVRAVVPTTAYWLPDQLAASTLQGQEPISCMACWCQARNSHLPLPGFGDKAARHGSSLC